MGQVADVIRGLEAKLAAANGEVLNAQTKQSAAEAAAQAANNTVVSLQSQLTAQAANLIDDADKAAIAEAQAILAPPAPAPAPAAPSAPAV